MSADIEITSVLGTNGQPLPIHGTGLGSTWSAPVKQERADDAEIQELAAKMKEAQKDALAKQQQQAAQMALRQANGMQPPVTANGQTNILNYLNRTQKPTNGNVTSNGRSSSTDDNKKPPCDEESQKGHFGWTTFGKTYIPYIYRQQEKYCSVRMIEMKLLGKYLNCLHPDIYSSCTCVRSYYITEAEARLFIEINHKHCDGEFGRDLFTQKDLVVRLSDATKFYQFLDICYRKLISGSKSPSEKCGFIRINKESVVPYTVRNGEQVVPLFYFEGETENLKQKADLLSGWDLAYLKFCCKVQGIRNELFSSENVAVISLTDIKSYFPNGTEFEDYWPSKVVDSNLLIGNRSNANNSVNWTRQPSQPPPKVLTQTTMQQKQTQHSSAAAAAAAAAAQQQQILKRGGPTAAAVAAATAFNAQSLLQQPNAAAAAAAHRMHSNAALAAQAATVQAIANGSWMSQQQNSLPLIHAQMLASQQAHQNQAAANSRNQYRNPMENLILNNRQPYGAYNNATISMQPVNSHGQGNAPPPLVRSAGQQNANHMSSIEQTLLQQQQQQTQQHQQRPNSSNSSQTLNHHQQQQQQRHINTSLNPIHSPNSLNNLKQSPSPSTPSPSPLSVASNANALLANNFNLAASSAPATAQDFNNLALWNQLTPSQRLALTQQFKNSGNLLGAGAGIKNPFPPLPSLPLDTDLITMLDYNPNKAKQQAGSANASNNGQFTKPHVPPLIPVNSLEPQRKGSRSGSTAAAGTVPLNSSAALEDFEKKFKMNDEMRAVVQKVLSNPDLSTFIQTNASNTFVPFISPPISPANGVLSGGAAGGGTSVSIVPNPHVTITPQLPAHFSHSSAAHSPSSASSTSSNSGGNNRQKSVICSTNNLGGAGVTSLLPSPSTSNSSSSSSSSSHSPSTRTKLTAYQHHHQQNTYAPPTQTQLSSNSSSTTPTPMEVIDLSSPRRSLQAATAYLQQQQQQQQQQAAAAAAAQQQSQQRLAAAAVAQHHSQQNGRSSSNSSASSQVNSASMHLQRHALAAAAAADSAQRLNVIPEIPANNLNMQPYKVQKVYVENKLVPCINMKAYNDSEQLMTLTDFQTYFYRQVPLDQCKRLIEALGVELYKGNRHQLKVLMEHDPQHNENIPLVQELGWGGQQQHAQAQVAAATTATTTATNQEQHNSHHHQTQRESSSSRQHSTNVGSKTDNSLTSSTTAASSSSSSSNKTKTPLAPPPPHQALDMLYSPLSSSSSTASLSTSNANQNSAARQHLLQQQQQALQQFHQHQQQLLQQHHQQQQQQQAEKASKSSGSSGSASHKSGGNSSSSSSNSASASSAAQRLSAAHQLAAAAAAESAAAYYSAAAAAAATMLSPPLSAAAANSTLSAVNPFANPFDWLGASSTAAASSHNVSGSHKRSSSASSNNSSTSSNQQQRSASAAHSSLAASASDFLSMFSSNHTTNHNTTETHHQRSSSNASASSLASTSSSTNTGGGNKSSNFSVASLTSNTNNNNSSNHNNNSSSNNTGSTAVSNSSAASSASLAAHAAAASAALFGVAAPFSAPALVNPYPPHLPGVAAAGAHGLPSPTIYPPTPPPSAPWIHPWYAGDTF
ncbi:hypothetical protein CVS40_11210 [Lucilia cuprina]|nr:hypothetical protein CVS40_11210 [Lucilia cuprina]KAI8116817.1 hypothetical protein CVS40_11210 [Lucilia cuprina]